MLAQINELREIIDAKKCVEAIFLYTWMFVLKNVKMHSIHIQYIGHIYMLHFAIYFQV